MLRLLLAVLICSLAGAQTPEPLRLEVRVLWKGELPPKPQPVKLDPAWAARNPDESKLCGRCADEGKLVDERLLVDVTSRGIANVAVSLAGLEGEMTALKEPLLDNRECRFTPRVLFAATGSAVRVRNSDPFAHTARISDHGGNVLWNALIANDAVSKTCLFPRAGLHSVRCDMHPWMQAWIITTRHPFVAVTSVEGKGAIGGIPSTATHHAITAWHEQLGTARRTVDFSPLKALPAAERVLTLELLQTDFQKR